LSNCPPAILHAIELQMGAPMLNVDVDLDVDVDVNLLLLLLGGMC